MMKKTSFDFSRRERQRGSRAQVGGNVTASPKGNIRPANPINSFNYFHYYDSFKSAYGAHEDELDGDKVIGGPLNGELANIQLHWRRLAAHRPVLCWIAGAKFQVN